MMTVATVDDLDCWVIKPLNVGITQHTSRGVDVEF